MSDDRPSSSTGLALLALGVAAGAAAALLVAARQRSATASPASTDLEALELTLRDELPWVYETSVVVHRPAGAIAVHVHDHGGLPGLVAPLEGPPMDRVDWQEPGGARLRMQVHALSGGGRSEVTVKVAAGDRRPPRGGLDAEVRAALTALRSELERSR